MSHNEKSTGYRSEAMQNGINEQIKESYLRNKVNFENNVDFSFRWADERSALYESKARLTYAEKSNELAAAIKQIYKIRNQQNEELKALSDARLQDIHEISMKYIRQRFEVSMQEYGGADALINTRAEAENFTEKGLKDLRSMDAYSLVVHAMQAEDTVEAHVVVPLLESAIQSLEKTIKPDTFALAEKLYKGEELTEKEWKVVLEEVEKFYREPKENAQISVVLNGFNQKQRLELVQRMMHAGHKDIPQKIVNLVVFNYLTQAQGEFLLKQELEKAEAALLSLKGVGNRKEKEALGQKIELLNKALNQTQSEDMRIARKQMQEDFEKIYRMQERRIGVKSPAKGALSIKGIASGLLFANGAFTIGANILVDATQPLKWFTNPYLASGFVMAGAGMHMSNGFGGTMMTPKQITGELTADKEAEKKSKLEYATENLQKEIGMESPKFASFYFNYADKIVNAYNQKRKEKSNLNVHLTLADLGLKQEELPQAFKDLSVKELELVISDWVRNIYRLEGEKANRAIHRQFITDSYEKLQGLNAPEWIEHPTINKE